MGRNSEVMAPQQFGSSADSEGLQGPEMGKRSCQRPSLSIQLFTPSRVRQGTEGKYARVVHNGDKRRVQEVAALNVPGHPLGRAVPDHDYPPHVEHKEQARRPKHHRFDERFRRAQRVPLCHHVASSLGNGPLLAQGL